MSEPNLLEETISVLKENEKTELDVEWVGNEEGFSIDWETFKEISNKTYDSGFGRAEVAEDLLVVGKDFWLERHEYDGSEGWRFKKYPEKPNHPKSFKNVFRNSGCYWGELEGMNR